jgi:hypothetical protein
MSTTLQRPGRTPAVSSLNLARVSSPVQPAPINDAWTQLTRADAQNVKTGREPYFPSVMLAADNGATVRQTIEMDPTSGLPVAWLAVVNGDVKVPIGGGGGGGGGPPPSNSAPPMNGIGAPGVSLTYARGDHVHPSDTSRVA